jgi:tRNA nucleotidyltransferase/poly(A) polymerase
MPDYIFMLESRLSAEQLQVLNQVQEDAQEAQLNLYLVGGAVRDLMTGSPIRDLDFVAEGNPLRLVRRFEKQGVLRLRVDREHRAADLLLANGVSFSLEAARAEFFREPGRPPETRPAPVFEDLRRRDFSINAMGISLTPGSRGLLLDPTNGLADVEHRQLRVLHNYSFVHDPLRMLRLLRFAARLNFKPEPRTDELFRSALERGHQRYLRPEALGREAFEIVREENAPAVLKALAEHGLLAVFHPLLQKRKPDYNGLAKLQRYRRQALDAGYRFDTFSAGLHYWLRRLPGRAQWRLLRNLGLKKQDMKAALGIEGEARRVVKPLSRSRQLGPRQVFALLAPVPRELLVFILAKFSDKQRIQAKVYNFLFKYLPMRQTLPVRELQLMGVPSGLKFDQILEKYFEAQLDGKLRSRPQQLRYLRQLAGLPKPKPEPKAKKKEKKPEEAPALAAAPAPHAKGEKPHPPAEAKPGVAPPPAKEKVPAKAPVPPPEKPKAPAPPAGPRPRPKPKPRPKPIPIKRRPKSKVKPKRKPARQKAGRERRR